MKRILTMLLALAMMFTLFACGKKPADDKTRNETPTGATAENSVTEMTDVPTEAPTEETAEIPTEEPTEASETKVTNAPSTKATVGPTTKETVAPTTKATAAPTTKATAAPTTKATAAPTTKATTAATTKATAASTPKATAAPTTKVTVAPITASPKPTTCSHSYKDATCTEPKTCSRCGATTGDRVGHNWTVATDTKFEICTVCGETKETPKQWVFTDGGDCIVAFDGTNTTRVAIDTSHLPRNYETETTIQTVEVFREHFRYVNGWIVYYEWYHGTTRDKDGYNASGFNDEVGYSIIKMDGTGQKEIFDLDAVVGYMDGYLYYQKAEGIAMMGETEHRWLCKRSFSEDGNIGEEIVITELENESNEYFEDTWFEDGWVFYSYCYDFGVTKRSVYKVLLDGTQCQKVS